MDLKDLDSKDVHPKKILIPPHPLTNFEIQMKSNFEIKNFVNNKSIIANNFRIQAYDSVMCGYFCIGFINFMFKDKSITGFTNFFSPNKFKKIYIYNFKLFFNYFLKMAEYNSAETPNICPNLNDQQQFRINKINEIKDYFVAEIKERKLMGKRLSKYIASFNCFDRSLIVLSATSGRNIASFATVTGTPVGIESASLSHTFSISAGTVKKLLKTTRNKKKKRNKIVMLARSKLNSIESKISEALVNNKISHEDFMTIINEEKNY